MSIKKTFKTSLATFRVEKGKGLEHILNSFKQVKDELEEFCNISCQQISVNKDAIKVLETENKQLEQERQKALSALNQIGKLLGE